MLLDRLVVGLNRPVLLFAELAPAKGWVLYCKMASISGVVSPRLTCSNNGSLELAPRLKFMTRMRHGCHGHKGWAWRAGEQPASTINQSWTTSLLTKPIRG